MNKVLEKEVLEYLEGYLFLNYYAAHTRVILATVKAIMHRYDLVDRDGGEGGGADG